jgi:hypothetical protein
MVCDRVEVLGTDRPRQARAVKRENSGQIKWAASQEAVTLPWLSAHSILKRIKDGFIVDLPVRLSRTTS